MFRCGDSGRSVCDTLYRGMLTVIVKDHAGDNYSPAGQKQHRFSTHIQTFQGIVKSRIFFSEFNIKMRSLFISTEKRGLFRWICLVLSGKIS